MASTASPIRSTTAGASASVLIVCLVLSVLVHIITAGGFGEYVRARPANHAQSAPEISIPDMPAPDQQEDPPIRLGRQESKTASITWLGVLENPLDGEAPVSEVEQAELAIDSGNSEVTQPEANESQQPVMTQAVEPIQEPVEVAAPPDTTAVNEPIEEEPEAVPQAEPEAVPQPEQSTPMQPIEPAAEPSVEANDSQESPDEAQAEAVEQAEQVEPTPEQPQESESELEAEPTEVEEASENTDITTVLPPTSPRPAEQMEPSSPTRQGKAGEEDDRESVASMIERADTQRATDLNRPLSSSGLEIKPVEPRFPAAVRFTQLPRNPIVLIRFNAQGRVIFTDFIRDEEKKRVYDTGSRAVDEPLLSAIYKWRAEGEPLKKLDPDDPKSYIEIPMKIIFREERSP
jgi:hypothetical protein